MNRHALQKKILVAATILVLFAIFQQAAVACPTCKNGLAEGEENVAQGYFWSILFMMSMPFLIFSALGLYFFLVIRRAKARQAQAAIHTRNQPETAEYFEPECADEPAGELVEV